MILIIAEKAIAGKRISEILADTTLKQKKENDAYFWEFDSPLLQKLKKNPQEKILCIPLSGHILNVDFPKKYSFWKGTDVRELARVPVEYVAEKELIVNLIKSKAKEVNTLIIATDYDREGEAIGFEAVELVQQINPKIKLLRANFSAMTKEDIEESFSNLKNIDKNLADSANTRREIDLYWGSTLTRFLSIVSGKLGKAFIGMGRVQGPTLALIVEKEKERLAFKPQPYWEINAEFMKDKETIEAQHKQGKFWDKKQAEKVYSLHTEKTGKVSAISKKEKILKRPVPFNTTNFLRAATNLGYTAASAMNVAESLYQKGFISYPRTDNQTYPPTLKLSKILSELAQIPAYKKYADYLLSKKKLEPTAGKETKDHPPLHPVSKPNNLNQQESKIYDLIARNFMAVLGDDAKVLSTSIEILVKDEPFIAHGLIFIEKGWKEIYTYSKTEENTLPSIDEGEILNLKKMELTEKETKPPARYSQGALLKKMEELNLGTKATRPEIIQKLLYRHYINGSSSLEPTELAFALIDSLKKHDIGIINPEMTAHLETEMDKIAEGKLPKEKTVLESQDLLVKELERLFEHKEYIGSEIKSASDSNATVGSCTNKECKGKLVIRYSRFGKRFIGCNAYPKCTNTFPLPQKGLVQTTDKICEICSAPMVKVIAGRRAFEMCINMDCSSKDEWKKKMEEKKAAQELAIKNQNSSESVSANSETDSPKDEIMEELLKPKRKRILKNKKPKGKTIKEKTPKEKKPKSSSSKSTLKKPKENKKPKSI